MMISTGIKAAVVLFVIAIAIIIPVVIYRHAYTLGYEASNKQWKSETQALESEQTAKVLATEREAREAQDAITSNYIKQIQLLKIQNESYIDSVDDGVLVGTSSSVCKQAGSESPSPTMPTKNKAVTSLTCYNDTELRAKIKSSLVIAKECDELATKYNSLIEACK